MSTKWQDVYHYVRNRLKRKYPHAEIMQSQSPYFWKRIGKNQYVLKVDNGLEAQAWQKFAKVVFGQDSPM